MKTAFSFSRFSSSKISLFALILLSSTVNGQPFVADDLMTAILKGNNQAAAWNVVVEALL